MVDTLKYVQELEAAGVPREHAEAYVTITVQMFRDVVREQQNRYQSVSANSLGPNEKTDSKPSEVRTEFKR